MKFKATHLLNGTLPEVLEIVMDRELDPKLYTNLKSVRCVKWHDAGDAIHCEYLVCGVGEIPAPLRIIASPHMLTWREIGCWDVATNTYRYVLRPHYFSSLVHAWGTFRFFEHGPAQVMREIEGEMRIDIPILGHLAAKTIIGYMLESFDNATCKFDNYLEELRAKTCERDNHSEKL